jgi:Na+/melibiose symporter-like transporter
MAMIIDLLPVLLAIVAIFFLSKRFNTDRRKSGRFVYFMATVCAIIMIVAQLSWWASSVLQEDFMGATFANILWTLFNSLTMITFILMSYPRKK